MLAEEKRARADPSWDEIVVRVLKLNAIRPVAYVPDSRSVRRTACAADFRTVRKWRPI